MILLRKNQSTGTHRHLFLLGKIRGIIFSFAFLLGGTYIQTLPRCLHSKHLYGISTSNCVAYIISQQSDRFWT
jgi:hypothetical protein